MQTFDTQPAPRRRRARWLKNLQWLYLSGVCLMLASIRIGGDRWGWATVLAYGPRDAVLVPGVLFLLIGLVRRGIEWVAVLALLIAAGPMMNFIAPIARIGRPRQTGRVIHVLQLNSDGHGTDGRKYDLPRVLALLRDTGRDVATIEEWPKDAAPPLPAAGWSFARDDEQLILSRWPIVQTRVFPRTTFGRNCFAIASQLVLPDGKLQWIGLVHLETPRHGFEPVLRRQPDAYATLQQCLDRRDLESETIEAWITDQAGGDRADTIVGGDFNLVGDGVVFRHRWGGWSDAFATAGFGWGQTKLQAGWRARIDHILGGSNRTPVRCWVGPDVNSDHLPLLADVCVDN